MYHLEIVARIKTEITFKTVLTKQQQKKTNKKYNQKTNPMKCKLKTTKELNLCNKLKLLTKCYLRNQL